MRNYNETGDYREPHHTTYQRTDPTGKKVTIRPKTEDPEEHLDMAIDKLAYDLHQMVTKSFPQSWWKRLGSWWDAVGRKGELEKRRPVSKAAHLESPGLPDEAGNVGPTFDHVVPLELYSLVETTMTSAAQDLSSYLMGQFKVDVRNIIDRYIREKHGLGPTEPHSKAHKSLGRFRKDLGPIPKKELQPEPLTVPPVEPEPTAVEEPPVEPVPTAVEEPPEPSYTKSTAMADLLADPLETPSETPARSVPSDEVTPVPKQGSKPEPKPEGQSSIELNYPNLKTPENRKEAQLKDNFAKVVHAYVRNNRKSKSPEELLKYLFGQARKESVDDIEYLNSLPAHEVMDAYFHLRNEFKKAKLRPTLEFMLYSTMVEVNARRGEAKGEPGIPECVEFYRRKLREQSLDNYVPHVKRSYVDELPLDFRTRYYKKLLKN